MLSPRICYNVIDVSKIIKVVRDNSFERLWHRTLVGWKIPQL